MNGQLPNFIMKRYANEQIVFSTKTGLISSQIFYFIVFFLIIFQVVLYVSVYLMIKNPQIANAMLSIMVFDTIIVLFIIFGFLKGHIVVTNKTVSFEMLLSSFKLNIEDFVLSQKNDTSITTNLGTNYNSLTIHFANNQDLQQFLSLMNNSGNTDNKSYN